MKTVNGNSDYAFIFDDFKWSFSRIDSYQTCPKAFFLEYVKCDNKSPNAFGEYGSFCHKLLEGYAKGEIAEYDLAKLYADGFNDAVPTWFPPSKTDMKQSYYDKGNEYFKNFEGFPSYEILGVENKYDFKVGKYDFVGFVDLEVRELSTKKLVIIDHKSKGKQDISRLTVKTKERMVKTTDDRYIPFHLIVQLYLYCIPFKEKHGVYPDKLAFNMFKINDWYEVNFNEEDLKDSIEWVDKTIEKIYNDIEYEKSESVQSFWCEFVCGQRTNCVYSSRYFDPNQYT